MKTGGRLFSTLRFSVIISARRRLLSTLDARIGAIKIIQAIPRRPYAADDTGTPLDPATTTVL
jgi:hypothetical protein